MHMKGKHKLLYLGTHVIASARVASTSVGATHRDFQVCHTTSVSPVTSAPPRSCFTDEETDRRTLLMVTSLASAEGGF
jgi:hypothetical protein